MVQSFLLRQVKWLVKLVALGLLGYSLLRLYAPGLLSSIPGMRELGTFAVGSILNSAIDRFGALLFSGNEPFAATSQWLSGIGAYFATNIRPPQLVAGAFGAGLLAAINGALHIISNRSIQRMCSAQLYVTAVKLVVNLEEVGKGVRVSTGTAGQSVKLCVDNDVRAAMHRLRSELELLQDFSIAYDYAFWRRLRQSSVTLRMMAMSIREAIDVIMTEIDRLPEQAEIDMSSQRYFAMVVHSGHDGMRYLQFETGIENVITRALVLAEKLELGWLFQSFEGSIATLPPRLKSVRTLVRQWLKIARDQLKREGTTVWWGSPEKSDSYSSATGRQAARVA